MKIGICCDHAGYALKEHIKDLLSKKAYEVIDFGCFSSESVDYPDFAHPMASSIERGDLSQGISICGSGNGISMVVNKYPHLRAALCWTTEIASLARLHNDANVLSLPARFVSVAEAEQILEAFLSTEFEGGRHQKRIDKIPIVG